ncbi:MAG: hypothetical protein IJ599_03720 [Alphaproteobacteria bacterium]|nr:hypothetical protein [Alphaproteobacteria bacterium]
MARHQFFACENEAENVRNGWTKLSKRGAVPVIQGKMLGSSTMYADEWSAYDGLILNDYDHYRVTTARKNLLVEKIM